MTPERIQIFRRPGEIRAWSDAQRSRGRRVGFVPTMGALHSGHMALVTDAQERCDAVVVSIFVNPLQFNEDADFDSYPRPIDDDVAACGAAGVAAVFAPTAADMYPSGFQTRVLPGPLGDVMEGPGRPGHFEGVATVVAKLFGAVRPDVAIFGQKDFQQLRIITQMSADLNLGVEIVGHPIVRDPDGLAQSSRNVRLSPQQRSAAVCVPKSLVAAADAAAAGASVAEALVCAQLVIESEPMAAHEYTTVFDPLTLVDIAGDQATPATARIATAVWFGDVRLIDNRTLFSNPAN